MELGLHFMNFTLPGRPASLASVIGETAQIAEAGGVSTFTVMDHWFQMEAFAPYSDPMLEGYSVLAYVAALTKRMRLGLLVTGVTYRHPGLLAKTVTTLDVLSGGRAQLGIGAAWYEREHAGLGVAFPPLAERFERLEEALQICLQMWSDNDGPYNGKHYQLAETVCSPMPVSSPRPHVLVGGMGERKTLRFVAKYADACNLFALSVDDVRHKLDVLWRHCETENRDPETVRVTVQNMYDPLTDPKRFLSDMETYAAIGVDLVGVRNVVPDPRAHAENLGEIVSALSQLSRPKR